MSAGFFFATGLNFFGATSLATTLRCFFVFFVAALFFLVEVFGFFGAFAAAFLRVFFAIADPIFSRRIAITRIDGAPVPRQGRRRSVAKGGVLGQ